MTLLNEMNINIFIAVCGSISIIFFICRCLYFTFFQGIGIRIRRSLSAIIENVLERWDNFRFIRFLIPLTICLCIIIAICLCSDGSLYIFGTLVASLLFVKLTELTGEMIYCIFEDKIKINSINKQYMSNYGINLFISNHKTEFLYKPLVVAKSESEKYEINIIHQNDNNYTLPPIIISNYTKLFYAHRNDYVENFDCVRLDDYFADQNSLRVILNTSEIKCFDHLVTNFALDYKIDRGITLRKIYENGDTLPDLRDSRMANQIGINVLVFLKDGTLLMPKRGNRATISRNMVTSSIAMAYKLKEKNSELTTDQLFRESVIRGLEERLYLSEDVIARIKVDIDFLGFGQVVVWGGKPQFYFCAWIDMDARQYIYNSTNVNRKGESIDKDKSILLIRDIELYEKSDYLKLICLEERTLLLHNKKKDIVRVFKAEVSFFCNCYHLKEYHMNADKSNNWLKKKLN